MTGKGTNPFMAGFCLVLLAILGCVFLATYGYFVIDPPFNKAVHGHIENAYWAADPVTMKEEVLYAKSGMEELGLDPSYWGTIWDFRKTPDKRMSWQYKHIDSVLVRIDEFERWESSQAVDSGTQQMKDVYTEKLDNVRSFIRSDTWSDWLAYEVYVTSSFAWVIISWYLLTAVLLLGIILVGIGAVRGCFE